MKICDMKVGDVVRYNRRYTNLRKLGTITNIVGNDVEWFCSGDGTHNRTHFMVLELACGN